MKLREAKLVSASVDVEDLCYAQVSPRRSLGAFGTVIVCVLAFGVLALELVQNFVPCCRTSREDLTVALVQSGINGTLDMFNVHVGRYPTTLEGLDALSLPPEDRFFAAKWRGPYVSKRARLLDAWGNELTYESPGRHNTSTYDLSSPGMDGQPDTDDDITNWK